MSDFTLEAWGPVNMLSVLFSFIYISSREVLVILTANLSLDHWPFYKYTASRVDCMNTFRYGHKVPEAYLELWVKRLIIIRMSIDVRSVTLLMAIENDQFTGNWWQEKALMCCSYSFGFTCILKETVHLLLLFFNPERICLKICMLI